MRKIFYISSILILSFILYGCANNNTSPNHKDVTQLQQLPENKGEQAWQYVGEGWGNKGNLTQSVLEKISHMTLEDKLGQMIMVGVDAQSIGDNEKMFIRNKHIGGFILYGKNIQSTTQTVNLINELKTTNKKSGNKFPLFISVDQEGGSVERLPSSIVSLPSASTIGNANNSTFSNGIGQLIGTELKDFGFNMDFAPVLDIKQSSRSAIGDRSYSSNKDTVSQMGIEVMKGIQSKNVIPVIKHFPGYGSVTVDAHKDLPEIKYGLNTLEKVDWVPYKKAIDNGANIVMVTHLMVPQLKAKHPASMSRVIITDMLREKLKFDGVVITDDMTMGAIAKHYSVSNAAVQSVKAGADIVLVAYHKDQQLSTIQALKQAVKNGDISMNRIDDSVYRIIQLKQKYKLTDNATGAVNVNQLNNSINAEINKYLP